MRFTKMHGCGNDYIYVDCFHEKADVQNPEQLSRRLSDRHFGIGSDGLIFIKPSPVADCFMDMYNYDGPRSEMCGNGIRCVGKYLYDHGIVDRDVITVDTLAGVKTLYLHIENGVCTGATVDMGEPILLPQMIPTELHGSDGRAVDVPLNADGVTYRVTCVSMGNPHAVVVVDDPASFPVREVGMRIETHPAFPRRTNVHFIRAESRDSIIIRTWERATGETLACGTGNCASLVAATLLGLSDGEAEMHCLGGTLHIKWDRNDNHVYMTGPAAEVFTGSIDI